MAVNSFNAQNPPVTTKGDLFTFSTIPTRLGVGANNTVLTADSSTATGLRWGAVAAGANWTLLNPGGTALTGSGTVTVSGISNADKIMAVVNQGSSNTASTAFRIRVNSLTTSIYNQFGGAVINLGTYGTGVVNRKDNGGGAASTIDFCSFSSNAASRVSAGITFTGCNSTGVKQFIGTAAADAEGGNSHEATSIQGFIDTSASITSISFITTSGNWDAGTVFVYTSA